MGLGDFFKKTFGKQVCTLCGNECGVTVRKSKAASSYAMTANASAVCSCAFPK